MKTNNQFNRITIDTARAGREKFDLKHDVNTTASIGDTQPLACRLLIPKSKTTLQMRHLIRMDPMVAPTYGTLKAKTWSMFVGMSDMLPKSFPALLAKTPIAKADITGVPFVPSSLPYMNLGELCAMILVGCQATVYNHDPLTTESAGANYTRWRSYLSNDSSTAAADLRAAVNGKCAYGTSSGFPGFNGGLVNLQLFSNNFTSVTIPVNASGASSISDTDERFFLPAANVAKDRIWQPVSLASADYVFRRSLTNGSNTYDCLIAVRLSSFGKRLRKILIGLGYQINFADTATDVNVLPLLAYYKAYFDTFGLTLYTNWESTAASMCLASYDANTASSATIFSWTSNYFRRFVYDLGNTFVTEPQDYITAHQSSDVVSTGNSANSAADKSRGFLNNIVLNVPGSSNGVSGIGQSAQPSAQSSPSAFTGHVYINRVNHTEVDAELLKTLYKWTNRQTIAGKRIAELLRAGNYGDYVDQAKSNFIGYEELEIEVADINASADSTNAVTGKNSTLGQTVGKGIGVTGRDDKDPDTVSFENDEYGYWITMFAITPESSWCQGLDLTLTALDADQLYNREFDGIGMELQPKELVVGGADLVDTSDSSYFRNSFGMVPRHSRYKVALSKINGDFSLRSTRDGYLPFTLDKVLTFGTLSAELDDASIFQFTTQLSPKISDCPVAGDYWRYLNRYPWLMQFERIFDYTGTVTQEFMEFVRNMANVGNYELVYSMYDHFVCLNKMIMTTFAPMLAIADSYGTTDENDGKGDTTFTKA